MVLEHPKLMLTESKQMSESLRTFYKASSDFIGGALLSAEQQINANCIHTCCCGARAPKTNAYGKQVNDLVFHEIYKAQSDFIEDASLSVEQQVVLKTRSLWLPLLADNTWEHPKDEPPKLITHDTIDIINVIVTEDCVINAIPIEDSDKRIKHDNTVVQYSRAVAYLREILNHTFLRTIFHTSSRKAELEYQEVQRNFINDHSNDDPDDEPTKFTALDIIKLYRE